MYKNVIVCVVLSSALLCSLAFATGLSIVTEQSRWKYFPADGACEFFLSRSGNSLFIKTEARVGNLGFFQNMQTGQIVRLRDQFSNLAYIAHADANRGYAIINDRGEYYFFDFKTLQKSVLENPLRGAFRLRMKTTSPNAQYLLATELETIAVRNFDSTEDSTDIQLKLPKDTFIIGGSQISDSGKTIAVQTGKYVRNNITNFKTKILRLSETKKPKISTLPGRVIYLSASGELVITQVEHEYNVFAISSSGELQPLQLPGLKETVQRLWKIANPNGGSAWASDVRISKGKISANGWWLVLDFQFAVKSNPQLFANGSQMQTGKMAGLVLRWDLQNLKSSPWASPPIAERYYDYLISQDGTLTFAAVDDKRVGSLAIWKSDFPEQRKELLFREHLDSKSNGESSVFDLRFSEQDRRLLLEMDNGLLVMGLPPAN